MPAQWVNSKGPERKGPPAEKGSVDRSAGVGTIDFQRAI